jgi:hypothetical protein
MPKNRKTFKKTTTGPKDGYPRVTDTESNTLVLYQDGVLQAKPETAPESPADSPHGGTAEEAGQKINVYEKVFARKDSSQHIISTTSATNRAIDVTTEEGVRQGLVHMSDQSVQAMFKSYDNFPGRHHREQNTSVTTEQNLPGQNVERADGGVTESGAER